MVGECVNARENEQWSELMIRTGKWEVIRVKKGVQHLTFSNLILKGRFCSFISPFFPLSL